MILYLILIFLFYIIFKNNNIIENLSYIYPDGKKTCCLIKKEYIIDETNPNGGDFKYIINNMKDDKCDYDLYTLNNYKTQLQILTKNNSIHSYPPLYVNNGFVAQYEHTICINENNKIIFSQGDDF